MKIFLTHIGSLVKAFCKKFVDLLTDSNGDGDVVRVFGLLISCVALYGWMWGHKSAGESIVMMVFGCGMLITGKVTDPISRGQ